MAARPDVGSDGILISTTNDMVARGV